MDVASSVGAIVGLFFNFSKAIKTCHDIKEGYRNVDSSVASTKHELETLQGALEHLVSLMMKDAAALSSRWDEDKTLPRTFMSAVKGIKRMVLVLSTELENYHSVLRDGGEALGVRKKAGYLWNQGILKEHLLQLRSQASALNLLLTVLQTGLLSEYNTNMNDLKAAVQKLSIVAGNAPETEPLPAYSGPLEPSYNLLDEPEDLMVFESEYPIPPFDSPPAINSKYGEEMRRALTPNLDGEEPLRRRKRKEKNRTDGVGLGISRTILEPRDKSRLLTGHDEFGLIPQRPLDFVTSQNRPRKLHGASSSSSSLPILDHEKGLPKPHSEQRSTLETLGVVHPSPQPAENTTHIRKRTPIATAVNAPKDSKTLIIEHRLAELRQSARQREQPCQLLQAVMRGDLNAVSQLIAAGEDIEIRHPTTGTTALIIAASLGNYEMLELLIDRRTNIKAVDFMERSALHYAASENFAECTELLLAHKAPPDLEDLDGDTPLHRAVRYLRSETVDVLLGWSDKPLQKLNLRGQSALHLAARNRGLSIIENLCDKVKKIEHKVECQRINDQDAAACTCPVSYEGVDLEDEAGDTAVQGALFRRSMDAVTLLLKYTPKGANAPQRIHPWCSEKLSAQEPIPWERPLHYAARGTSKTLVKRLLDAGADVNLLNSQGQTPLEVAIMRRNTLAISLLLGHPDSKCNEHQSASNLMEILTKLTPSQFEEFLPEKLDFGVENSMPRTLLSGTIVLGRWNKLRSLLERSVSTKEVTGKLLDEENAFECALRISDDDTRSAVVELVLIHGANINAKLNQEDKDREYCLHFAAAKSDIKLAEVLAKYGARIFQKNSEGCWPFYTAVSHGNDETVRWFHNATTASIDASASSKRIAQERKRVLIEEGLLLAVLLDCPKTLETVLSLPCPLAGPSVLVLLSTAVFWGCEDTTRFLLDETIESLGEDVLKTIVLDNAIPSPPAIYTSRKPAKSERSEACMELIRKRFKVMANSREGDVGVVEGERERESKARGVKPVEKVNVVGLPVRAR